MIDGSIGVKPVAMVIAPTLTSMSSSLSSSLTAPTAHTFSQRPHSTHFSISIMYACGIACANGSAIASSGHSCAHLPHEVHVSTSTYRGIRRRVTLKSPTFPSTDATSVWVYSVMFGWLNTSTIFGVRVHCEQSNVGNVFDRPIM